MARLFIYFPESDRWVEASLAALDSLCADRRLDAAWGMNRPHREGVPLDALTSTEMLRALTRFRSCISFFPNERHRLSSLV
jgi:hypothetical protein